VNLKIVFEAIWKNPANRDQKVARVLRAVSWQIDKRLCGRPRLITLPNGVRMWAHPDCVVSSSLIYADWPEYFEFQFIRRQLRTGDYVIDVGANVGHVLLLLADIVGPDKLILPSASGELSSERLEHGEVASDRHRRG
jgi:hypothetical protein